MKVFLYKKDQFFKNIAINLAITFIDGSRFSSPKIMIKRT